MKFYNTITEAITGKKVAAKGEMAHFFKVIIALAADLNEKILLFFDGDLADTPPCQHENGDLPDRPALADIHSRLVGMATGSKCEPVVYGAGFRAQAWAAAAKSQITDPQLMRGCHRDRGLLTFLNFFPFIGKKVVSLQNQI